MAFCRFISSLLTALFVCYSIQTTLSLSSYFSERVGLRSSSGILQSLSVATSYRCAVECLKLIDCNSYNVGLPYAAAEGEINCELVRMDPNSLVHIVEQSQWTLYSGKRAWSHMIYTIVAPRANVTCTLLPVSVIL